MYKLIATYKTPKGNHTIEDIYKSKSTANMHLGHCRLDKDCIKSEVVKVVK